MGSATPFRSEAPSALPRRVFLCALAVLARAAAGQPAAPALRRALQRAPGVAEGRQGPWVHVFFDLRCPVCALLHRRSRAGLRAGAVRLHWIPVALLGAASLDAAARLLGSDDLPGALARALAPGAGSSGRALPAHRAQVEANTALLRLLGGPQPATPSLVFEDERGGLVWEVGLPPRWGGEAWERGLR
jgi:hypothetical protein